VSQSDSRLNRDIPRAHGIAPGADATANVQPGDFLSRDFFGKKRISIGFHVRVLSVLSVLFLNILNIKKN